MWADRRKDRQLMLHGLVLAIVLLGSFIVLTPRISELGSALTPSFSRPNILVDSGAGWVGSSSPGGPSLAVDPGGVIHAAWMDNRTGTDRGIYYSRSDDGGATWIADRRIDGFVGFNNLAPVIAADTSGGPYNGYIYVAWQVLNAGQYDIYVIKSMDGGNTWSALDRHQVDTRGASALSPGIAVDSNGWVYVSFHDLGNGNLDIFVARSGDGGSTWLPETQLSTSANGDAYPVMSANAGLACVAWQEASATISNLWLACSSDNGNSWGVNNIVSIPASSGSAYSVSITIDPSGTVHAVWETEDAMGAKWIPYSRSSDLGATWSPLSQVDDVPASVAFTSVGVKIVHSSGILFAVWADNRNGDNDIFCSWSEDNGATWGDGSVNNNDVRVDDTDDNGNPLDDATDQSAPSAVPGPFGVYVIWSDRRSISAHHAFFAGFEVSEILITEVRDGPDGLEEVELFNHGGRPIDLTGWGLYLDGVRVDLSPLGSVPIGAYVTVGDSASCTLSTAITLGDEGGAVLLLNQVNTLKDAVYYGQQGFAPDPLDSESVERVSSGGGYSDMWTRQPSPTFGGVNNRPMPASNPPLVLNEVLFNAANANDRFVEIFLRGLGSLNLTGFILAGDSAYALPSVTLSLANPFYIVRASAAPALFSLMDAVADNLYLYGPGGILYDMVGWSSSHMQDRSMVRIPDGSGTCDGFEDVSSYAAGWRFDQVPSLPLVLIGPRQTKGGDLGARVFFVLGVTNKEPAQSIANILPTLGPQSWSVSLFMADGVTPLPDSPGDADLIPDSGLLAPEGQIDIQVAVDIPTVPQAQDWETAIVTATIAGDPLASASVPVTTNIFPYESPASSANPTTIWIDSSPPTYNPKVTTLSLSVTGRGTSTFHQRPQDTVFVIDGSGSMGQNDPTGLRLQAASHYVDLLTIPDTAAVVQFSSTASLVNGDHLSTDYPRIKSNINSIGALGGTNLLLPLQIATDEIISNGNLSHVWIEIFLTDGDDTAGNTDAAILAEAQRAANNGIVIFTIGLIGAGGVNEALLQQIAALTGGVYMRAQTANDLDAIYQLIGQMVKNLAGYDNDVTDSVPMISVYLPTYIGVVPGTVNPVPSYTGQVGGMTNLQWNLSKLSINETWTATVQVTSSVAGTGLDAIVCPSSRVSYIRYDDTRIDVPFPPALIDVLAPPPPPVLPVNYTITRNPVFGNITVDNVDYPAPWTFSWLPGEMHNISVPDFDVLSAGERWFFVSWNDSGSRLHMITVINATITITAGFSRQFRPSVNLLGIDVAHSVTARFTFRGSPISQPGAFGAWSDWVDASTAMSFDTLAAGSNSTERWTTQETFSSLPWISVDSAFSRDVAYWHQVTPTVVLQGLPPTVTVPIRSTQFGLQRIDSSYSVWTTWTDYRSLLSIGGQILIPPNERYVNRLQMGATTLEYTVTRPASYAIPFLHQFRPTVYLVLTDGNHTVDANFTDTTSGQPRTFVTGLFDSWSGWADWDTTIEFSNQTTGDPPYTASNETTFRVTSAFVAYIVYAPPQAPATPEPNYKPLISLAFVAVLVCFGLFWGNRKPLDRYLPPAEKASTPEERRRIELELRQMTMEQKLKSFAPQELDEKFLHDRRLTMSILATPFAAVEGLIGIASYATGILSVPEAGNWFSIGLIANTAILMTGLFYDLIVQRYGYRVPSEEVLTQMRSPGGGGKVTGDEKVKSDSIGAPKAPSPQDKADK